MSINSRLFDRFDPNVNSVIFSHADNRELDDPKKLSSLCTSFQTTIPGKLRELYTHFLSKENTFLGRIVRKIENSIENEKSELQKAHTIGLGLALEDVADPAQRDLIQKRYDQYLTKDFDNIRKYPERMEEAQQNAIAEIEEGRFLIGDGYEAVAEGKKPSELSYLQLDLLGEMISVVKDRTLLEFMFKVGDSRSEDIPEIKAHLESIANLPSAKEKAANLRIWLRNESVQELLKPIVSMDFLKPNYAVAGPVGPFDTPEEITLFPSIDSATLFYALILAAHNENFPAIHEILRDGRVFTAFHNEGTYGHINQLLMIFYMDSGNSDLLIQLSKNPLCKILDPASKEEILTIIDTQFRPMRELMRQNPPLSQEKINEFKKTFMDYF